MFRPIDVEHMKRHGVLLGDFAYMSHAENDHGNARAVLDAGAGRPLQEVDGRGFPALRSEQALQLLSGPQSGLRPRSPPWPDASGQRLHPCHRPRSSR
jgi:hypothetical protein